MVLLRGKGSCVKNQQNSVAGTCAADMEPPSAPKRAGLAKTWQSEPGAHRVGNSHFLMKSSTELKVSLLCPVVYSRVFREESSAWRQKVQRWKNIETPSPPNCHLMVSCIWPEMKLLTGKISSVCVSLTIFQ